MGYREALETEKAWLCQQPKVNETRVKEIDDELGTLPAPKAPEPDEAPVIEEAVQPEPETAVVKRGRAKKG